MTTAELVDWATREEINIRELIQKESRALAISFPDEAVRTVRKFQEVLKETSAQSYIFAAHKATDRTHVIRRLVKEAGIGVDVASLGELDACLKYGITPDTIIVTGPKSQRLLMHAVEVGVRAIVVDSYNELERLAHITTDDYPDVLLRLSRSILNRGGVTRGSRFGFDQENYERALALLSMYPNIPLLGLAFHLDTKSVDEKSYAAHVALDMVADLPRQGFTKATVLDIGGGFGHAFGLSRAQIHQFDTDFRQALREGAPTTYQSMTYGLKKLPDGQIVGAYAGLDIPSFPVGSDRLASILSADDFAAKASEYLVQIWCEPGSALFAEAGAVISEIIDVTSRDGRLAIVTTIHHGQVLFDGSEVLVDPLHLPTALTDNEPCEGYILGTLCMETDILSHRSVSFAQRPQAGDLLIWPHTGAYRMHMSQTSAIMHPEMARYRYEKHHFIKENL